MSVRVLVAYGTKHGATQEIAEKIGEVLQQGGHSVDVVNAGESVDLASYGAVILGSGVYIGAWRKEAKAFLKNNAEKLAQLPVWLFSSGPTGEGDPKKLVGDNLLPAKLQPIIDRIDPRDVAIFHGAMQVDELNFIEKWMIKQVGAPVGDYRDWDAITAWAESIAGALRG